MLQEELTLPDGRSFGAAIIGIEQEQAATRARVDILVDRAAAIAREEQ